MGLGRVLAPLVVLLTIAAVPEAASAGTCSNATAQALPAGTTGVDGNPLAGDISGWYQVSAQCDPGATSQKAVTYDCTPSCDRFIQAYVVHTPEPCVSSQTVNPNDTLTCVSKPDARVCMYLRTSPGPSPPGNTELTVAFEGSADFNATLPLNTTPGPACELTDGSTPPDPPQAGFDLAVSFVNPPVAADSGAPVRYLVRVTNLGPQASPGFRFINVKRIKGPVYDEIEIDGAPASRNGYAIPVLDPLQSDEFAVELADSSVRLAGRLLVDGLPIFYVGTVGRLTVQAKLVGADPNPANNTATATTNVGYARVKTSPHCSRATASAAKAASACRLPAKRPPTLRGTASGKIKRVEVALMRKTKGTKNAAGKCRWLANAKGKFKSLKAKKGKCKKAIWLKASGRKKWSFKVRRRLPAGNYVVYSRGISRSGGVEASANSKRDNRLALKLR